MSSKREERRFLHDLSSPLTIAHGNLKILLKKTERMESLSDRDDYLMRLNHAMMACERLAELVAERRQYIITLGQDMSIGDQENFTSKTKD